MFEIKRFHKLFSVSLKYLYLKKNFVFYLPVYRYEFLADPADTKVEFKTFYLML